MKTDYMYVCCDCGAKLKVKPEICEICGCEDFVLDKVIHFVPKIQIPTKPSNKLFEAMEK